MKPSIRLVGSILVAGVLAFAGAGCAVQTGNETTDQSAKPLDGVAGPGQTDPNDPNAPFQGVGLELSPGTPKPAPQPKQAVPTPIPWHDQEQESVPTPIPWMTANQK